MTAPKLKESGKDTSLNVSADILNENDILEVQPDEPPKADARQENEENQEGDKSSVE